MLVVALCCGDAIHHHELVNSLNAYEPNVYLFLFKLFTGRIENRGLGVVGGVDCHALLVMS